MNKWLTVLWAVALLGGAAAEAQIYNEWIFDLDPAGRTLPEARNSGSQAGTTTWKSADTVPVTQTDGAGGLVLENEVPGIGDAFTDGVKLRADIPDVFWQFVRLDLEYDMTAAGNDTGTLLALAFADSASAAANLAGFALYADVGAGTALPSNMKRTDVAEIPSLTGRISVIAQINIAYRAIKIWYDFSGENTFNPEASPNATVSIDTFTYPVRELEFRATGDLLASPSNKCVRIDNLRTANSWADITSPLPNYVDPPELVVSIDSESSMAAGQTDTVTVTIDNRGGVASNAFSQLTHDGGDDLQIVSSINTPGTIAAGYSADNTFELAVGSDADGEYTLTAQAFAEGGYTSMVSSATIYVGSRVRYDAHQIANDMPGPLTETVEPGDTFDLVLISTNDTVMTAENVINNLLSSTYLTVLSNITEKVYPSVAPSETAVTIWRVVCAANAPDGVLPMTVINRTADKAWTNQVSIDVVNRAILSGSAVTIAVAPGETASAVMTVTNSGNRAGTYRIMNDGGFPVYYTFENAPASRQPFWPSEYDTNTVFTWDGSMTEDELIGFPFSLYGTEYATFRVNRYGELVLETAAGDAEATVSGFSLSSRVDESTVRVRKLAERLVVAWDNNADKTGSGHEYQTWINADGTIRFLYEEGEWDAGVIRLEDRLNLQTNLYTPGGRSSDSLLLSPVAWVTLSPASGSMGAYGSRQEIQVTADASWRASDATGTFEFSVPVLWESGSTAVDVDVVVEAADYRLDVPASFMFSGPAGLISPPATMVISNSGNAALTYTIEDAGARASGYSWAESEYRWRYIPDTVSTVLSASDLDTKAVPIGFPFVFYGDTYTHVVIGTDGTLTFADGVTVVPYSADLRLEGDAEVRFFSDAGRTEFVVNWIKMRQSDDDAEQTFEAVLHRDGSICFNYRNLGAPWTDGLIRITGDSTVSATLSNELTAVVYEDVIVTDTNYLTATVGNHTMTTDVSYVYATNVMVDYVDTLWNQAVEFIPGQAADVIRYAPVSGTIAVGDTTDITLRGDARGLSAGGSNDVVFSTDLLFAYDGGSPVSAVSFTAEESEESVFSARVLAAAQWGSEEPVVCVQQNADGTRTLSWPEAADHISRVYDVLYTTNLVGGVWSWAGSVTNDAVYVDTDEARCSAPMVFYRVSVK